jgi:hypothetical protein
MSTISVASHFLVQLGSVVMAIGLIGLSIVCTVAPNTASEMYGLSLQDTSGWLAATGLRDFGLGVSTIALFVFDRPALRIFVPSLLIIPIGDAAITLLWGGSALGAATHLLGAVAILLLAVFTWLDPALDRRGRKKE